MIVILMGVAGSGKTTIGRRLAQDLNWESFDADDFHPAANVEKMRRGEPLTDDDRVSWLAALRGLLERQTSAVLACSALKKAYRERLTGARFVYLKADRSLLERRLDERHGHFFNPELLDSQLAALEEPGDAVIVDAGNDPNVIVQAIRRELGI